MMKHLSIVLASVLVVVSAVCADAAYAAPEGSAPSAPRGMETMVETPTSIKVTWNPPVSNGDSAIDKYKAEISEDREFASGVTVIAEGDVLKAMAKDLKPKVKYYFRVSAHNAHGYGDSIVGSDVPSEQAAAPVIIPGAAPIVKTPEKPAEFTAVSDSHDNVLLNWKSPPIVSNTVPKEDKFALDMAFDKDFKKGLTRLSESNIHTFRASGLAADTVYWFRVTSHNKHGYGDPAVASARTSARENNNNGENNGNNNRNNNAFEELPGKPCPNDCSGNGICLKVTGTCNCLSRFEGPACNVLKAEREAKPEKRKTESELIAEEEQREKAEEEKSETDPLYCKKMCGGACSDVCRRFCPAECPRLNRAPSLICTNKCGGACSVSCTRICPEQCPAVTDGTVKITKTEKEIDGKEKNEKEQKKKEQKKEEDGDKNKQKEDEDVAAKEIALAEDNNDDDSRSNKVVECAKRAASGTCIEFKWNIDGSNSEKNMRGSSRSKKIDDAWDLIEDESAIINK